MQIRLLLGEPRHGAARALELVVEVVLDVRVGDVFAMSAARCGFRSVTVIVARRESLSGLTEICAATRAAERRHVVVRAQRARVVGVVLQPQLLGGPLPHVRRLDDLVLRLVELLVAPEGARPHLDDVLRARADTCGACGSMMIWQFAS